ncbi:MAG: hypothetical protein CMN77_08330 [Spirochaetaceae bacterium]|nr:hypothetical protein [Spirochaetaceae bacterium]|tara:strand:+ start:13961 stop:14197 length:237 start_codon:yes stop_codon:yes gene_type:complete
MKVSAAALSFQGSSSGPGFLDFRRIELRLLKKLDWIIPEATESETGLKCFRQNAFFCPGMRLWSESSAFWHSRRLKKD